MLTNEETLQLIKDSQAGDKSAKEKLLIENSPLIKSIIKIYKHKGIEYDDLYQLGCLGFLKAINNFDTTYDVKFSTYAVPMIAGEVKRFLRDDGAIKVSRSIKALQIAINKYVNEYKNKNDCEPTIKELAEHFNMESSEIIFAIESGRAVISLDERIDEDNSRSRQIIDTIPAEDESEKLINKMMINKIIKELPDRDRKLLYLRYFQDKTQTEIAKLLGVSQVQVSRLENKLLEKIRNKIMQ